MGLERPKRLIQLFIKKLKLNTCNTKVLSQKKTCHYLKDQNPKTFEEANQ